MATEASGLLTWRTLVSGVAVFPGMPIPPGAALLLTNALSEAKLSPFPSPHSHTHTTSYLLPVALSTCHSTTSTRDLLQTISSDLSLGSSFSLYLVFGIPVRGTSVSKACFFLISQQCLPFWYSVCKSVQHISTGRVVGESNKARQGASIGSYKSQVPGFEPVLMQA